jgi:hypothetical protein
MSGLLFRHNISLDEIMTTPYSRLKYWNEWAKFWDKNKPPENNFKCPFVG